MIFHGDALTKLRELRENSIDSVVTDPPAGIGFMGKAWDSDKGGRAQWIAWMTEVMRECNRVLKPGAHALVWAIPRTSHWTATAIEDAGFEIRDVVTHLFGAGFPKSLDISKAIDKEAGANRERVPRVRLGDKAAYSGEISNGVTLQKSATDVGTTLGEPVTNDAKKWQGFGTALKPAAEFWVLARKPLSEKTVAKNVLKYGTGGLNIDASRVQVEGSSAQGRFPANLVLSGGAIEALDEQSGQLSQCGSPKKTTHDKGMFGIGTPGTIYREENRGASRFFYCAKVSPSERGEGNTHPTVKSRKLMQYLIKLITPPGGIVLDPFTGSGTTGVAAKVLGFKFVGIEKEKEYVAIAEKRIEACV